MVEVVVATVEWILVGTVVAVVPPIHQLTLPNTLSGVEALVGDVAWEEASLAHRMSPRVLREVITEAVAGLSKIQHLSRRAGCSNLDHITHFVFPPFFVLFTPPMLPILAEFSLSLARSPLLSATPLAVSNTKDVSAAHALTLLDAQITTTKSFSVTTPVHGLTLVRGEEEDK